MNSERTQIARAKVSAPTRWILGHVDLSYKSVLHHGEGKAILDTVAMNDAGAYFEFASPEKTSVKVLHRGSGFVIIDVWR